MARSRLIEDHPASPARGSPCPGFGRKGSDAGDVVFDRRRQNQGRILQGRPDGELSGRNGAVVIAGPSDHQRSRLIRRVLPSGGKAFPWRRTSDRLDRHGHGESGNTIEIDCDRYDAVRPGDIRNAGDLEGLGQDGHAKDGKPLDRHIEHVIALRLATLTTAMNYAISRVVAEYRPAAVPLYRHSFIICVMDLNIGSIGTVISLDKVHIYNRPTLEKATDPAFTDGFSHHVVR